MSNKMLVDAIHPEETRVVVVRDKRVEDFDFEAASRKPLRGNIYLAKVTRVEPSLQAAFVDYGGNRHGFLAFSEIHPDYYQIPQADRAALLEQEREQRDDEEEDEPKPRRTRSRRSSRSRSKETVAKETETAAEPSDEQSGVAASAEQTEETAVSEPAAAISEDSAASASDETATDETSLAESASAPEAEAEAAPADTSDVSEPQQSSAADEPEATAEAADVPADTKADEPAAVSEAKGDAPADETAAESATKADAPAAETPAESEAKADAPADETAAEAKPDADASAEAEPAAEEKPKPKRRRRTTTSKTSTKSSTTKKSDDGLEQPMVAEREADDEDSDGDGDAEPASVANPGNSDALEEIPERRRRAPKKHYKIQDVIKRRQILLVQVVKEERGTKGAALTTYLSLAGRYSVLMPNTDRGGGVSRKITDNADRKRLKGLVAELDVPDGMGIILRTAGASRTKTEIKRDFEYLIRLWDSVRELTLKSIAPNLVYEEGNLVKRAIRDLYSKEIDEVLVSGESAYREAKDFMKMLMPSHAKNVKPYREPTPIFTAHQIEAQLDAMFSPHVTLPSKGYIVINPTEALVSIDVNSGRSTKESNIEDTALKTNLEAADEVARQLRLRDLAGLIVIDFIDMDEKRHNRAVEKRLKDALKLDRSRIQVGRISSFGLLEMSRQRIRQGMVETSQVPCAACSGTGLVRSTSSVALFCLRSLEEYLLKKSDNHVTLRSSTAVALYILNQKRGHLRELEERFQLEISVEADEAMGGNLMEIVSGAVVDREPGDDIPTTQLSPDAIAADDDEEPAARADDNDDNGDSESGSSRSKRKRRRRRRGSGASEARSPDTDGEAEPEADGDTSDTANEDDDGDDTAQDNAARADDDAENGENGSRRRRRGRRGGRRHRREDEAVNAEADDGGEDDGTPTERTVSIEIVDGTPAAPQAAASDAPVEAAEASEPSVAETDEEEHAGESDEPAAEAEASSPTEHDVAATDERSDADADDSATDDDAADDDAKDTVAEVAPETKSEPRQRRVGWWQRRSFF